jgi:hypothetical protein
MLPLDKEILAAYIIIHPNGTDPSKDPIGRSWTGGPVMYHHYHANIVKHTNWGLGMKGDLETGEGQIAHLHGTAGYPAGTYFDENGYQCSSSVPYAYGISYQDESNNILWGGYSENINDDRGMYYDDNFIDTMTNIPGLYDR